MGCCFSSQKKQASYPQELGNQFLKKVCNETSIPTEAVVLVVKLKCLRDVSVTPNYTGKSGPYVEIKLSPSDGIAGDQLQRSSYKPGETNPRWEPPERFQYLLSEKTASKLKFSVYNFNPVRDPDVLGDAVLNLKDIDTAESSGVKQLRLISPHDGKQHGQLEFEVLTMTVSQAISCEEHCIYEFQRWQPVIEWGHSKSHLLPTDPGRWCDSRGKLFNNDMEQVSPALPDKWTISKTWYTIATIDDPDGWHYSDDFYSLAWYSKQKPGTVVRRRMWARECLAPYNSPCEANNPIIKHSAWNNPMKSAISLSD